MQDPGETARELILLEEIERDPDTTQASLAAKLGVAVGTVNWHVKRLVDKGYVKVKRAERRKLRYIITPDGLALRARLTVAYIGNSLTLYRETREQAKQALEEARKRGFKSIGIEGDGELAEICRLTCLEQGFPVAEDGSGQAVLEIKGRSVRLRPHEPRAPKDGPSTPRARSGEGAFRDG
jgi:DNA-binding MarR family transcriptional regulator